MYYYILHIIVSLLYVCLHFTSFKIFFRLPCLQVGSFELKLNHRRILDGMMAYAGVPASNFRAVCSAIDKLDKEPWSAVRHEMTTQKNVPESVADTLGEFVQLKSECGTPSELCARLRSDFPELVSQPDVKAGLEELDVLF